MPYSKLLQAYIDKSGLTLDEITERCKARGIDIHPTYISKLRNGTRPAPSEEISRVLAEVLEGNPDELIFEGYLSKTPLPIINLLHRLQGIFSEIKEEVQAFISFVSRPENSQDLERLSRSMGQTPDDTRRYLLNGASNLDKWPVELQLEFIASLLDNIEIREIIHAARSAEEKASRKKIPLLGTIRAGVPILAAENWEEEIEIPSNLKAEFALRIVGDSMVFAGISPGDIALCNEADYASHGQIVAAGVEESEWRANLKFYVTHNGQTFLRSANPEYKDIEYGPDHRIIGTLAAVLKDSPPSLTNYQNLLRVKNYQDDSWTEVISAAVSNGIKPGQLIQLIEMQAAVAKQYAKN